MKKTRVLLIDDEPGFTRMLKLNLEQAGRFEVREENEGLRAFATAKEFQPDVILLDIIMPDCDGSQLAAEIQADPQLKGTPVIFLTAIVSRGETFSSGGTIGGNTFIAKPASADEVITHLERYGKRGTAAGGHDAIVSEADLDHRG